MFDDITELSNLAKAHANVMRGKQLSRSAASAEYMFMTDLLQLQGELRDDTYQPSPYRNIIVYEPKTRHIQAPAFRDRVVHHAVHRYIEPLYERRFIPHSFACRRGLGTHKALEHVQHILRQPGGRDLYVLSLDISKYFPSINHAKLKQLLAQVVDDSRTLSLLYKIIDSAESGNEYDYLFTPDSPYHSNGRHGLPIGNLTSQLFANIYLHHADMYAKQKLKIHRYVRYMDDILIFHHDKHQLIEWQRLLLEFLSSELHLVANPRKVRIYPSRDGVAFVGFHVFPGKMRLRGASVRRFKKRFNRQLRGIQRGTISPETVRVSLDAYPAHASHAKAEALIFSLQTKYNDALSAVSTASPSHLAYDLPHQSHR